MTGVHCILERDGKFLYQLRDNKPWIKNPNAWGMFGGGIEEDESPEEAIIREIKEELGIYLDKNKLKKIFEGKVNKTSVTVFKHPLEFEPEDLTLNEGQDMKLFTKEELQNIKNIGDVSQKILNLI